MSARSFHRAWVKSRAWCAGKYWLIVGKVNKRKYLEHKVRVNEWEAYCQEEWEEIREAWEDLALMDTAEWTKRATKVYVNLREIPLPEGRKDHWMKCDFRDDGLYLNSDSLRLLQRRVEEEEHFRFGRNRAKHDLYLQYIAILVSAVAAAGSWLTYFSKR
jgi:hypothetical protein